MVYEGDILEHALNFGVNSSAQRYDVNKDEVYKIVNKFREEISICECEFETKNLDRCPFFMCTGDNSSRIKI